MIALTLLKEHRSINSLPSVELPDFTVVTGVNGSGKTHLLEAISKGFVQVEAVPHSEIKKYDWTSLNIKLDEIGDPLERRKRTDLATSTTLKALNEARASICAWFPNQGFKGDSRLSDFDWLISSDAPSIIDIVSRMNRPGIPPNHSERIAKQFSDHFIKFREQTQSNALKKIAKFGDYASVLAARADELSRSILQLDATNLEACTPLSWSRVDALEFRFAELFSAYFATWERNRINRFYAEHDKVDAKAWLQDDEFIKRYGPPPWDLANSILERAGFRYRFNFPKSTLDEGVQFKLRLTDLSNPLVSLKAEDLSSGERILLSITLLLYQITINHQLSTLPKLLLLDEVDAPLHPSYTKVLLEFLQDTLVEKHGLKVILTTHSPSTVALASESALYELQREPRRIDPVPRALAVQKLTSGFITVMPTSRVVVTESGFDSFTHANLQHSLIEAGFLSESPPLSFVPASKTGNDGDSGGSAQVEIWAPKLNALFDDIGFRGLIDRDKGRSSYGVIRVLNRYSIENYLLDPLSIVTLLIKDGTTDLFRECPIHDMNFHRLATLEGGQLQSLIDDVVRYIENEHSCLISDHPGQFIERYLSGAEVRMPCWVRDFRGHDLETIYKQTLNPICSKARRPIALPARDSFSRLLEVQTRCLPSIIPCDLRDVYSALKA